MMKEKGEVKYDEATAGEEWESVEARGTGERERREGHESGRGEGEDQHADVVPHLRRDVPEGLAALAGETVQDGGLGALRGVGGVGAVDAGCGALGRGTRPEVTLLAHVPRERPVEAYQAVT